MLGPGVSPSVSAYPYSEGWPAAWPLDRPGTCRRSPLFSSPLTPSPPAPASLSSPQVPKSIAIIGGGYIAVEFAGIFAGLGSEVHLFYRQDLPLGPGFDAEVRTFAAEQYAGSTGIHLHPGVSPESLVKGPDGRLTFTAAGKGGGGAVTVEVDACMAATGRRPNVKGLGLEAAGVALTEKGAIQVDAYSQTTVRDPCGDHDAGPLGGGGDGMSCCRFCGGLALLRLERPG